MSIKNQRANVTPAAALRQQVRATLPNAPAKGHCLAYVLLEATPLEPPR